MVADLKRSAAECAVCYVESGMVVGLGSGDTVTYAVRRLGQLLRSGSLERVVGVATSRVVAALAEEQGIPLTTLEEHSTIDLTIDGADEVDPHLDLIKGHGGALLYEKIVALATRCEVIVVDEGKLVPELGARAALPVEVVPFGWPVVSRALADLGARVERRMRDGEPVRTDEGNLILDCRFPSIPDVKRLDQAIRAIPGVVEHGLFLGLADLVIVAGRRGLRLLRPRRGNGGCESDGR